MACEEKSDVRPDSLHYTPHGLRTLPRVAVNLQEGCDWPYDLPVQTRIAKSNVRISKSSAGVGEMA
eukprot:5273206-Pyramimonas_sp.AAC.1